MSDIASTIERFLQQHNVNYEVLRHPRTDSLADAAALVRIPASMIARAVMLTAENKTLVAVLPLNHMLDFEALEKNTGKSWAPVPVARANAMFPDCEEGTLPALANAYGIQTLVDKSLLQPEIVVFEGGIHSALIRVRQEDFRRLFHDDQLAAIAQPEKMLENRVEEISGGTLQGLHAAGINLRSLTPGNAARDALTRVYELPVLPQHVQSILALRDDPKATPRQLAELVERDASLAAQVIRYARSPFFGISEQVKDIRDAITLALGFDMVMNLALGLATFSSFKTPADGPLGLKSLGRHSVLNAMLTRQLVQKYQLVSGVSPGEAYLAGLLHNLGYLLYSYLFQPEFYLLNRMVHANPQLPVTLVEKRLVVAGHAHEIMQLGHDHAGSLLMEHWQMPPQIVTACREHHNPEYDGVFHEMANLVYVSNSLLKMHQIGDADSVEISPRIRDRLQIGDNVMKELRQEAKILVETENGVEFFNVA